MILAADIGGTKTLVALFDKSPNGLRRVREARFASREHGSFEEILKTFLREAAPQLDVACVGVAGPVDGGRSRATYLPWELDEQALARTLRVRRVRLLNDVQAAAYGMLHLSSDDFAVLHAGAQDENHGNIAVIAAGTGLGESLLFWDGERYCPIASEGGHVDFAPRTARETALLQYLQGKYGPHVSYERVLSGSGVFDLYRFLRESASEPEPEWLSHDLADGDRSAAIAGAALAGRDPTCVQALEMFAAIYGAEAGNVALKFLATGGVIVAGGIAPRILPVLEQGRFVTAFLAKGRDETLLRQIPVKVALNTRAPLLGAAHYALRL